MACAYRCPYCRTALRGVREKADCPSCARHFEARDGIIDLLGDPASSVLQELRGLASENGIDPGDPESTKRMRVAAIEQPAELMDRTRLMRVMYYQQNLAAYLEALGRAQLDSHLTVLEVGADYTLHKLRMIGDLADEAYALNIFFRVPDDGMPFDQAQCVLGDINALPFVDCYFDLLIASAVLHHSADMVGAFCEIARVLKPGGRAVVVNEPVEGRLKSLGCPRDEHEQRNDRHEDVHEEIITDRQWKSAVRAAGLRPDYFLPAWFSGQVRHADTLPAGVRFAALARRLQPVVGMSGRSDVLRSIARAPGQAVLGLPFNAVLWKI